MFSVPFLRNFLNLKQTNTCDTTRLKLVNWMALGSICLFTWDSGFAATLGERTCQVDIPPTIKSTSKIQDESPRKFTLEEQTNINVYERSNRGVVNIDTRANRQQAWFLEPQSEEGSGSGWVLDNEGQLSCHRGRGRGNGKPLGVQQSIHCKSCRDRSTK